jgi:hypothetical protein
MHISTTSLLQSASQAGAKVILLFPSQCGSYFPIRKNDSKEIKKLSSYTHVQFNPLLDDESSSIAIVLKIRKYCIKKRICGVLFDVCLCERDISYILL